MIRQMARRLYHDDGLSWRALRGGIWTVLGFGGSQAMRLVANLLLARLLFPSAFGTMALVMLVIQLLNNFSDVGTRPAVLRSARGDDPDFLNTAWTIEIMRGVILWLACCLIATPYARFYDAPELAPYLMVGGLLCVVQGLMPMRALTAARHLSLRQVTKADLLAQLLSNIVSLLLVWMTGSIWALVVMLPIGAAIHLLTVLWMIPGHRDRLHWDRQAVIELTSFGKWIFPSTIMGSLIALGDKAILGRYLTLTQLGLYNIGYFLAGFPMMLGNAIMGRIMIPMCRESPPSQGPEEFRRIQRVRFALTGGIMGVTLVIALLGPWIVGLLYDPRYAQSGTMLTLIACVMLPQIIVMGYDQMILAAGDSRGFFLQVTVRAVLFITLFWAGSHAAGLYGALIGQFLANVLHYPVLARAIRRHGGWDPFHDAVYAGVALVGMALIVLPHLEAIRALAQVG